jgi:hypothetical protein
MLLRFAGFDDVLSHKNLTLVGVLVDNFGHVLSSVFAFVFALVEASNKDSVFRLVNQVVTGRAED